ncbi:MAG: hypothetical protein VYA67_08360 [Actinomycetota bacterium]|uniref:Glyoxalase/bleomycin resistance protein/dioxygenase n=1 Tax=Mycobacterium lentiflavum TaxID=141349 RepID=A0ABY3UMT3_MYCLN|nr:hypothetical protein [Mycobacterium lentiflavum]MEE3063970.1 hypothetical protein [Actinomycetota bacterium]ULP40759.1 hypothetical protein MJO58_17660 [Mycobacterium lentiflavum]
MPTFRAIDPHGEIVAARNFDSAEAAHAWFLDTLAGRSELGWRMEVDDNGSWAFFDDTGGFTAPVSRRPRKLRIPAPRCS